MINDELVYWHVRKVIFSTVEEHSLLCSAINGQWIQTRSSFFSPAKARITWQTEHNIQIWQSRVVKETFIKSHNWKICNHSAPYVKATERFHLPLSQEPLSTFTKQNSVRQKHQHEVFPLISRTSEYRQETLFVLVVQIKNWGVSGNVIL